MLLLSACRDGDESRFGRPGGWEECRDRRSCAEAYVRCAGKATHFHILKPFSERLAPSVLTVSDPRLLRHTCAVLVPPLRLHHLRQDLLRIQQPDDTHAHPYAGRRHPQVLGQERCGTAWAVRHHQPGRRCQRSLPAEINHQATHACPTCSDTCSFSIDVYHFL